VGACLKRPSFQFYPADWQANSNLRRCSHAEKGVWVDLLCLLHDQPEYGVLRWQLKEIAQAVGCAVGVLRGIVAKNVFKGHDIQITEPFIYVPRSGRRDGEPVVLVPAQVGPIWYSSRMVRDEYVRTIRGESTRFGEGESNPKSSPKATPKHSPKPPFGDGASSSSSSPVIPPIPPKGARPTAVSLKTWLESIKAKDEKPVPDGDAVFTYAEEVGIPHEFLRLAWLEFRHRYGQPDAKRYRDWRAVFRKAVRGNWLKVWYFDAGAETYGLTTVGIQAQRAHAEKVT
jgi:hypothetical protein